MKHNHQPLSSKNTRYEHHEHDSEHAKPHSHNFRSFEKKRLLVAIILTLVMLAAEIIGGVISGSLALLSDAGHMLTHSFALLISFLAIIYACRPATREKTFGFYRAEILAALFNGITLIIITGFILWEAYKRIINPRAVDEGQMFIIAIAGLAVNIATALILWKASKKSLNIKSAFIHMVGDAASSVAVVAGAVIIYFTGFYIIDPLLSIIIAILILVWSISLIRDSVRILMESAPKSIDINRLYNDLVRSDARIKDMHDLHVWEITTDMYCMSAHIIIEDMSVSATEELLLKVQGFLEHKYKIIHPIIQFETGEGFMHDNSCRLSDTSIYK